MNVKDALRGSGLPSADAEVLLSRILGKDRSWLISHGNDELMAEQWARFSTWVDRRRKREPVAYIIGEQEFHGRLFTVDRRVLIPRPATEGVVQRALQFLRDGNETVDDVDEGIVVISRRNSQLTGSNPQFLRTGNCELGVEAIVDVGTGSGCIAVTLALERPDLKIIATDISADALEVARMNAKRHGVADRIFFKHGRGLEPVQDLDELFLLVSNPPYIPLGRSLMKDVQEYEPHVALFGGTDGNDITQSFVKAAQEHAFCVGWVMEGNA